MSESRKIEEAVEFADSREPRCRCILLLDFSYSNDVVNRAAQRIRHEEARKGVAFFAVGGDYRVLFEIEEDVLVIYRVKHRKDAYS